MRRRILALLLALTMTIGLFPVNVMADDEALDASNQTGLEEQVTYDGSGSFGTMLAEQLAESQTEQNENENNFIITDITMYGSSAFVTLSVQADCTLLVAAYDDEGQELLAYGTEEITADSTDVTVELATGTMPEHFLLKGFLLDTETLAPLGECYSTPLYTEAMQTLMDLSTTDFEEERVLNLDEDTENNFAIYAEDTIVIEGDNSATNVIVSADDESGIYVIENASSQMLGLRAGDVFAYPNGDDVLIVKVKSISTNGTTVTITADEAEMEDVFEYVKIDVQATASEAAVDTSSLPEGVQCDGLVTEDDGIASYAIQDSAQDEKVWKFTFLNEKFGNTTNYITINATMKVAVGVSIQYYLSLGECYLKAQFPYSLTLDGEIIANGEAEIPLTPYRFSFMDDKLLVNLSPTFVMRAYLEATYVFKVQGSIGFHADFDGVRNISESPTATTDWNVEGTIYIGLAMAPEINFLNEMIYAKVSLEAGAQLAGKLAPGTEEHICAACLDGAIDFLVSLSVKCKLGSWEIPSKEWPFQYHILDFYYSLDNSEWGIGDCPHVIKISSGTCGDNLTWKLKEGVLTISGIGPMEDYNPSAPWYNDRSEITKIVIADGVTSIGDQAFYACENLENVSIPDSVASIGCGAFMICSSLTSINISASVNEIGSYAFYSCVKLKDVTISDGVIGIDLYAFSGCKSLTNITLPASITYMGGDVFSGCTSLSSVIISDGVTDIGAETFSGCTSLSSITIPGSVDRIGYEVFRGCTSLSSVTISEGVVQIGDETFRGCTKLSNITIPDSVTSIGKNAFYNCASLTSVAIPNRVSSIGEYAFSGCSRFNSITIPNSVTKIGAGAFEDCTSLTSIAIPDGITRIYLDTFSGCVRLRSVAIPSSVTSIEFYAFENCGNLTDVYYAGAAEEWASISISDSGNDALSNVTMHYNAAKIANETELYDADIQFAEQLMDSNLTTFRQSGLSPDMQYVLIVSKGDTAENMLASGNLVYIDQKASDENGNISFSYKASDGIATLYKAERCIGVHNWNSGKVTSKASCTEDGVKTYTCQTCGQTRTEKIAATGHNYESKVVKPTCTEKGYTLHTCKNCSDSYKDTYVDATGHSWDSGKVTTKATCTKNGVKTYTCQNCGETKTEKIAATGHSYESKVVKPTCTEKGYTLHTCKNCSDSYKDTYVDATGHSWDKGTVTKAPTATEKGVKTYTCKTCGKTKTEEIAKLSNPFTDLKNPSSYYDAVLWAVDKGITKGTSATEFSPKADCTRAQIVTFLWRYAGEPEPTTTKHKFVDIVEGSSYYKAVLWAVEKGITNGLDETHFGPKEPCTRAQIVTFLWRAAGKPEPSSQKHSFTDIVKGSSYYDAVLWAVEKGITTGADSTHFAPKDTCTRAQGMTFLYRYNNTK